MFSEAEIPDIKEYFSLFDTNNDGQIIIEELSTVSGSIGHTPTENHFKVILNGSNSSGSAIDFHSFLKMVFRLFVYLTRCLFDKDGDGFVTHGEIKQVLSHLAEKITDEEATAKLKEVGSNHDGNIQYEEFAQMVGSKE